MKKKLGNILIFILIIGLTIGYGIYKDDQSKVTVNKIYTTQFQEQALSDLENERGNGNYTLQNIFMKYNPFSTNTQSMYVYFNTSKVAKITYTVSCIDYADFTATAYQAKTYQKEHEFQLIGLIPECTNTITITAMSDYRWLGCHSPSSAKIMSSRSLRIQVLIIISITPPFFSGSACIITRCDQKSKIKFLHSLQKQQNEF